MSTMYSPFGAVVEPTSCSKDTPRSLKRRIDAIQTLERMTFAVATAVNTRDWDPKSSAWSSVASDTILTTMSGQEFDVRGLLRHLEQVTSATPSYHIEFVDLYTTMNSTLDRGEVFARAEKFGDPPGVVKKGLFQIEYRLMAGEWKWVKQTSFAAGEMVAWE
ncbi:hypothetical protein CKM354_000918600 [Cercospora kikuchii]|uniref:SnoaL-like domain-containing protein n=1 Tax=Cercospora kikuchii TaxID=84275 RepID=A0A9P3CNW1_9PEZI|nr:uncharacterized protein CKM354_000918600 [Cercospora kikuchii]GIZ46046.1 hypothetical protein CKM354_000918600 [Cercospora kikuchii]